MTVIFIDTNILLHFRRLDEIEWQPPTGTSGLTLVLTPIVLRELDRHKDSHSQARIRKRAQAVIADLSSKVEAPQPVCLRANVTLEFVAREPRIDFENSGLTREVNDDVLLAHALERKKLEPCADVLVATTDLGLKLKARAFGVRVIGPPAAAKLADEADPNEDRIRALERELAAQKRAVPKLSVTFENNSQLCRVTLPPALEHDRSKIDAQLLALPLAHPKLDPSIGYRSEESHSMLAAAIRKQLPQGRILASVEEIENYNARLDDYYSDYEKYLNELAEFERAERRSFPLSLLITNEGTAPAEDIDVHLHFPDGFALFDSEDDDSLPQAPEPPDVPEEPGQSTGYGLHVPAMSSPDYLKSFKVAPIFANISSPSIKRTNSYDVSVHVKKAKHGCSENLGAFLVRFDSDELISSFRIDYRLLVGNVVNPFEGHLSVVLPEYDP